MDYDSSYHQELAQVIRNRQRDCNLLQEQVQRGLISSRSRWKNTIENVDFEFPELSYDDLRSLFLGVYKLKLASAYVEEHLDDDGNYLIELDTNHDDILRCTIQSRHSNATKYKTWIKYSLTGDPIVAWYCTCPSGALTIGACSHVVSIVWYLCYARHHDIQPSIGRRRIQQAILERKISDEVNFDGIAEQDKLTDEGDDEDDSNDDQDYDRDDDDNP